MNVILVLVIHFSICNAQTTHDGEYTEEQKNRIEELRPKSRTWSQLNKLMSQVIDDTEINENIDCSFVDETSKPTSNIYQNILYSDYLWSVYKSDYGSTCIELTRPILGFLNQKESKVLLLASQGYGFEKLGLWEEVGLYYDFINSINETSTINNEIDSNELPQERSDAEIDTDTSLLKTLKNQIVPPLTYFIYQIYENIPKCKSEYNDLDSVCMEAIEYDEDNRTITFNYLNKYRVINTNSKAKNLAVNSINDAVKLLGIDGKNNGMLQAILEDYEIPIKIKKSTLFLDNKSICIKISMYVGYIDNDANLLSYYGVRECNGEFNLIKKVKIYAL